MRTIALAADTLEAHLAAEVAADLAVAVTAVLGQPRSFSWPGTTRSG
jgi:hypothetical protein